jgi:hypothetical protein
MRDELFLWLSIRKLRAQGFGSYIAAANFSSFTACPSQTPSQSTSTLNPSPSLDTNKLYLHMGDTARRKKAALANYTKKVFLGWHPLVRSIVNAIAIP